MNDEQTSARPGWLHVTLAAMIAVVLYVVGGIVVFDLPVTPEISGLWQFALSAAVPMAAFFVAVLAMRKGFAPFGFRRVPAIWLLAAAGVGLAGMGATTLLEIFILHPLFPDAEEVQVGYNAAATGGLLSFLGVIALGGVIEPFGEELLFRGVIANFMKRWGPWVMILGSSAIFALAHGVNLVTPSAFIMGLGSSILYWRTGSIWPSVVVHMAFNTSTLILLSTGWS